MRRDPGTQSRTLQSFAGHKRASGRQGAAGQAGGQEEKGQWGLAVHPRQPAELLAGLGSL